MKVTFTRKALQIVSGIAFVLMACSAYSDVTIKRVPMSERQAAITDDAMLYQELCSVCHGSDGMGNGPAISALNAAPSNLTVLTLENNGTFPRKDVKTILAGRFRDESHHGSCGMPSWYRAFSGVYPEWPLHRRHAFAMSQVSRLTDHLEAIQVSHPDQLGFARSPADTWEELDSKYHR